MTEYSAAARGNRGVMERGLEEVGIAGWLVQCSAQYAMHGPHGFSETLAWSCARTVPADTLFGFGLRAWRRHLTRFGFVSFLFALPTSTPR